MVGGFGICTIMSRNWGVLLLEILVSRNVAAKFRVKSQASPCRIFGSQRYWYRLCYECVGVPLSSLLHRRWILIFTHSLQAMSYSGLCYNERCYNDRMLQRTVVSINSGCYNERGGILSAGVARAYA